MNKVEIDYTEFFKDISDKGVNVLFKEATYFKNELEAELNEVIGTVTIVYPFAGMKLQLELDITVEYDEVSESNRGAVKLPFVEEKAFILHVLAYSEMKREYDREQFERQAMYEASVTRCSCGGVIEPMYEEFPNWITFCTKCDKRMEDTEFSPIAEPID